MTEQNEATIYLEGQYGNDYVDESFQIDPNTGVTDPTSTVVYPDDTLNRDSQPPADYSQ